MFILLLLLVTIIFFFTALLISCSFIKNNCIKNTLYIIVISTIIMSVTVIAIDLTAYFNKRNITLEHISLSQPKLTKNIGYFSINDTYWSFGRIFHEHEMITAITAKNTEIRFIHTDTFLKENKLTIYYLPISKFIAKIEVPMQNSNLDFRFFTYGIYAKTAKRICYPFLLSINLILGTIIIYLTNKMKCIT